MHQFQSKLDNQADFTSKQTNKHRVRSTGPAPSASSESVHNSFLPWHLDDNVEMHSSDVRLTLQLKHPRE